MKVKEVLAGGRRRLAAAGVEEADIEAEVLLREALGRTRAGLLAGLGEDVTPRQSGAYDALLARRLSGEPVAYILGRREFYGRDFAVDGRVLIPRPETELLVEQALVAARGRCRPLLADVGTGSGAVAITLALELPEACIYASDISPAALEVARANCRRYGVAGRVSLLRGDLLEPLPEVVDIIVANLPYVSRAGLVASRGLAAEPRLALDGGRDGLEVVRRFLGQVAGRLRPGGRVIMEIGLGQAGEVRRMLRQRFPLALPVVVPDLSGIERIVSFSL